MKYVVYNRRYLKPLTVLIRTHMKLVPPYVEMGDDEIHSELAGRVCPTVGPILSEHLQLLDTRLATNG